VIKWGVLGTGSIANIFIESLKVSKESELFGIASRSDKRAKEFSSLHDCLGFTEYDELIKQKDINAIYIATPHTSHFNLTFQSLMRGKPVLCEKPLATNSSEVMILIDLARKKNLLLMEALMYRMHAQTDMIKEIVITEFLNKEVLIEASFGFEANVNNNHRLLNPELGGGSIRIHDSKLQSKIFDLLGIGKKEAEEKFGFLMNAFKYGAPPHGGIAPEIDRIVMLLAEEKNIREVTMFPMNQNAQDLMMKAPSNVTEEQLKELNLTLKTKK